MFLGNDRYSDHLMYLQVSLTLGENTQRVMENSAEDTIEKGPDVAVKGEAVIKPE